MPDYRGDLGNFIHIVVIKGQPVEAQSDIKDAMQITCNALQKSECIIRG